MKNQNQNQNSLDVLLAKAKTLTAHQKLKEIENDMYAVGKSCVSTFNQTGNIINLRGANTAYRCSMVAMRDQRRYQIIDNK